VDSLQGKVPEGQAGDLKRTSTLFPRNTALSSQSTSKGGLVQTPNLSYLARMYLPRPVSPIKAFADLRAFFASEQRYRVGFALLSMLLPCLTVGLFYLSEKEPPYKDPVVVYVKEYKGARTDAEIRAQLTKDYKTEKPLRDAQIAAEEKRRKFFKDLAKSMDDVGL
jgi:hypothetical protein